MKTDFIKLSSNNTNINYIVKKVWVTILIKYQIKRQELTLRVRSLHVMCIYIHVQIIMSQQFIVFTVNTFTIQTMIFQTFFKLLSCNLFKKKKNRGPNRDLFHEHHLNGHSIVLLIYQVHTTFYYLPLTEHNKVKLKLFLKLSYFFIF